MRRSLCVLLVLFAAGLSVLAQEPRPNDEPELKAAGVPSDGKGLLGYFRRRTLPDVDRAEVAKVIARLADDSFEFRQGASRALVAWGPAVLGMLRQATRSSDPQTAAAARECLLLLRQQLHPALTATALRVLVRQRPAETVAVLLAYAPNADDDTVAADVRAALVFLGVHDGKPDPALVKGLTDVDPVRRAVAAEVLCQAGVEAERPAVRRLLTDPDSEVRRRAGLALVAVKDAAAVPALIDLLPELAGEEFWHIDDLLCRLAGEQAPAVPLGQDAAGRRKYRDAWAAWWKSAAASLDLARREVVPAPATSTLLVVQEPQGPDGEVTEIGPGGKQRWQFAVAGPVSAEWLPGGRVLVAEYADRRVTERDTSGQLHWEKQMPQPVVAAQRFANGHTFIACRNQLIELDDDGKEVFWHQRRVRDVLAARKLPAGPAALVTQDGVCVWVDTVGKEMMHFPVPRVGVMAAGIDVLPNRRLLVPDPAGNRVVEYDCAGTAIWQVPARAPTAARRLAGGHTVISSASRGEVVEVDRAGNVLWRHEDVPGVVQASRR
jgi:hypothetical protein